MLQYSAINVKAVITGWLILLLSTELAVETRAQSGEALVPPCITSASWTGAMYCPLSSMLTSARL